MTKRLKNFRKTTKKPQSFIYLFIIKIKTIIYLLTKTIRKQEYGYFKKI